MKYVQIKSLFWLFSLSWILETCRSKGMFYTLSHSSLIIVDEIHTQVTFFIDRKIKLTMVRSKQKTTVPKLGKIHMKPGLFDQRMSVLRFPRVNIAIII